MNLRDTVAPIPIDLLKEYFTDDSIIFNIDYADSTLKGDKLITYISNLDVPTILCGWSKVSKDDKFELIQHYMNSKLVINNFELEDCVLRILHEAAYLHYQDFMPPVEGILNQEEIVSFVKENKDLIDRWLTMCASLSVYAITTITEFDASAREQFKVIDDYDWCGVNFAALIKHDNFQSLITLDCDRFYFEKQFHEHMFKGKNLFFYWQTDANIMAILADGISSGTITHAEFYSEIQKGLDDVSAL